MMAYFCLCEINGFVESVLSGVSAKPTGISVDILFVATFHRREQLPVT